MKKYFPIMFMLAIICLPILSKAQDFGDGTDDVPIDGGLSLLIAAGVGYGAKKLKLKKNKNMQNAE